MTPQEAAVFAEELYDGHPAAAPLLLARFDAAADAEYRERARQALLAIDPMMPLPAPEPSTDPIARWRGGPLEGLAAAVTDLLLISLYCTNADQRGRAAKLVASFCEQAAEIYRTVADDDKAVTAALEQRRA